MNLFFSLKHDTSAKLHLEVCDKDKPSISLPELEERLKSGEGFHVTDPITKETHAVLCCSRHEIKERMVLRTLSLAVQPLETFRCWHGEPSQWRHQFPLIGAETCMSIAKHRGEYTWCTAEKAVKAVLVLSKEGSINFFPVEEQASHRVSPQKGMFYYHVEIADHAPCVFFDGGIRTILADSIPPPKENESPVQFEGECRFYLHRSIFNSALLKDYIRTGRVPTEGGDDDEALAQFKEVYATLAASPTARCRGNIDTLTAGNCFCCIMPHAKAAVAISSKGEWLAFAWDGKSVRDFNTLLALAATRTGRTITCAELPSFLEETYAALQFDPRTLSQE